MTRNEITACKMAAFSTPRCVTLYRAKHGITAHFSLFMGRSMASLYPELNCKERMRVTFLAGPDEFTERHDFEPGQLYHAATVLRCVR